MRLTFLATLLFTLFLTIGCQKDQNKILIFSKTAGFRHGSIETGIEKITILLSEKGYNVEATEDASIFNEEDLSSFSAVIFLNSTGELLDDYQQNSFRRYIQAGGGFVGIHAASDAEYGWHWYGKLVGAYFQGHPAIQEATLNVLDHDHSSTAHLKDTWVRTDEWYNFKQINPDINVLISIDEKSYTGGNHSPDIHPMSWYHEFDGGKSFYTEFGHTNESFEEEDFMKHILGGVEWAKTEKRLDYSSVKTPKLPSESRFSRIILANNLDEPMEMEILPSGDILIIERKGVLNLYDQSLELLTPVTQMDVFTKFEDGLLGMALDPNFEENNWLYLFYSNPGPEPEQYISRFQFVNNELDKESEQKIITIPVQRDECCHAAGCLEFGPEGNLYISVGDNTNPFASDGYAPIDERPGRSPWDAQKSSANANDLRGGILRIKPNVEGGGYSIPEGNLFPEGTPNTRPEIFVMGCRNPFRMSIDQKTGELFWGDVGPDAGKDNGNRGPKGYDELNRTKTGGFFGWPLFRGISAYKDYNFATKENGEEFDPTQPINNSPNNTGIQKLPPFNKATIWYSYDKSPEFPWVGTGGKNPMAGPVYYNDQYESSNAFSTFFDGKLFFYEWMRDWIYIIEFDDSGKFLEATQFMPNTKYSNPIDMAIGKDGSLYILEYGEKWYARNQDARLNKIEYFSGNQIPLAKIDMDTKVGGVPLEVNFLGENSVDFDGEELTYNWDFGSGKTSSEANPSFTYTEPGIHKVKLTVTDENGKSMHSTSEVTVGNNKPSIEIILEEPRDYFWSDRSIPYEIKITDKEDPQINDENVRVSFHYLAEGEDLTTIMQGHTGSNTDPKFTTGKKLISESDCSSCHNMTERINGPSYEEIARKYEKLDVEYLAMKVIKGGSGVWGHSMMSAHPTLTEVESRQMIEYILSLDEIETSLESSLPMKGEFVTNLHGENTGGKYLILASYTDQGNGSIPPLTTQIFHEMFFPKIEAEKFDEKSEELTVYNGGQNGETIIGMVQNNRYLMFKDKDLSTFNTAVFSGFFQGNHDYEGSVELRLDEVDGPIIGSSKIKYFEKKASNKDFFFDIKETTGRHNVYFVFVNKENPKQMIANANWVAFQ